MGEPVRTVELEDDVLVELERRKLLLGVETINAVLRKELNLDEESTYQPCWRVRL